MYEDDYLLNSVIVETVNLVVSKPKKTENMFQGSNSNLKNFKKFKRVSIEFCTKYFRLI